MNNFFNIKSYITILILCFSFSAIFAQENQEVIIPGIYKMPEVSADQMASAEEVGGGSVREDLHKFMGFEPTLPRYLSLPYDVFIKTNITSFFVDVGFLLLLIIPIIFLFPNKKITAYHPIFNLLIIAFSLLLLIVSIPNAYLTKNNLLNPQEALQQLNAISETGLSHKINTTALSVYIPIHTAISDSLGQKSHLAYPIIIILFLLLSFLLIRRIDSHSQMTKATILLVSVYMLLWWMLGAGAAWYGILLFCVPYVFMIKGIIGEASLEKIFSKKNSIATSFKYGALLLCCFSWIFMAFTFRSTNFNPTNEERAKHIYIPPITQYQVGNLNKREMMGYVFPMYYEIQEIVNRDESAAVYRVGTAINFFINKNDERVLSDTYLDRFSSLVNSYKNKQKIIQALKDAGYKYIILDLQLAVGDFTPEKALTRKFTQLMNTLYGNPGVELLLTNRKIKLHSSGEVVNAVFEDKGEIVDRGQIALFEIK